MGLVVAVRLAATLLSVARRCASLLTARHRKVFKFDALRLRSAGPRIAAHLGAAPCVAPPRFATQRKE